VILWKLAPVVVTSLAPHGIAGSSDPTADDAAAIARTRGPFTGTDRFQVVGRLGAGAMGEVYEAVDLEQDTRIALKVLGRHDARFLYRFKREFRAVQALEHRNLAGLGQLHEHAGLWFFTMELVDGVDFLRHVWRIDDRHDPRPVDIAETLEASEISDATAPALPRIGGRRFDEERVRDALRQLAEALHALHAAGKIHRDIKPSNVLVEASGRVVLLDFGLVADAGPDRQFGDDDVVGTPIYMAPEQATSGRVDQGADCYALGVMLYEALTGQIPFTGSLTEILVKKQCADAPDPRAVVPGLPEDLARLCVALLAAEPAQRPTAAEIVASLSGGRTAWPAASLGEQRETLFIGRDAELARLRRAVAETVDQGIPGVVHVEGQSGVGKSALIDQFCAHLSSLRDDVVVLSGRCYEREMTHYRAFDGLVDAIVRHLRDLPPERIARHVPEDAALLSRMFPMFQSLRAFTAPPATTRPPLTEQEARGRAYAAFRHVVTEMARHAAIVVCVDDVQWADKDSLRLFAEILRPPAPPPVLVILASRPLGDHDARSSAHAYLTRTFPTELVHVPLAPLSDDLAAQLARFLLAAAGGARRRDAADLAREAGGHPLHIAELVRHVTSSDSADAPLTLEGALVDRLSRLPAPAQQIARVLALAGAPVRPGALRRAAQITPVDFQRAVTVLRLGHLAKRSGGADNELLEPYHDRVRRAVLAQLDPDTRRDLHGRLVVALTADGAPPEALLRHLQGSGDLARAARCAVEAARRAAASMAYERAAELYRHALRMAEHRGDERRELQLLFAEALLHAGRSRDAADAFLVAADGADPDLRLRCQLRSAEQYLISGYLDEGLSTVDVILREIDTPLPATPLRALSTLLVNRAANYLSAGRFTARRLDQIAPEVLTRIDVFKAVSYGLAMVDSIRGADFNARFLRLARRTGEPLRLCRALGAESVFLSSQGAFERADAALRELATRGADIDSPAVPGWIIAARGCLDYFQGRFAASERAFEHADDCFRLDGGGDNYERTSVRVFRAFSLIHGGRFRTLQPLYDQWLADAQRRGDRYLETVLRRCCVWLSLARGDVASAIETLDSATWPAEHGFHLQHWYEAQARGELALCGTVTADDVARMDDLRAALGRAKLDRVQVVRSIATWLQARTALAAASDDTSRARAARRARRAARALRGEQVSYATLWADLLVASERMVMGDRAGAAAALRSAIAGATSDQEMYAAIAQRCLAGLTEGDEAAALLAASDASCAHLGISDRGPLTRVFLPGFPA
jgi:hypothetical protein